MRMCIRRRGPVRSVVVVSAFGLLLAACGSADDVLDSSVVQSTTSPVQSTTSTTVAAPTTSEAPALVSVTPNAGDLRVIVPVGADGRLPENTTIGCHGGRSFPAFAVDDAPLLVESGLAEVEAAIGSFLEGAEGAFWPQSDWRILHRTDDRVLLVHSDGTAAEPSIAFMEVEKHDGEWRWAGSSIGGGCSLEVNVSPGLNAVDWRLDPSAAPLTPESTVIHVLVIERACASGEPVGERLLGPEVVVTDTEVLIAFAAQAQSGPQECPGHPETPVTIELSGPIGARVVTNGLALDSSLEDLLDG